MKGTHGTKPVWNNCVMAMLYLYARKKINAVLIVQSNSKWWPFHYLVYRKGYVLHFNHILPHRQNPLAPFWFIGRYEVMKISKLKEILKKEKRKIYCVTTRVHLFVLLDFLFCALIAIPWMLAWFFYPLCWSFYWLWRGRSFYYRQRKKAKTFKTA